MNPEDHFLLGWLDALWSTFSDDVVIGTPTDISRKMLRKGWLKPLSAKDDDGCRGVEITPLGIRLVKEANEAFGIRRKKPK